MITKVETVDEWLEKIDGERAAPLSKIRKVILRMVPKVDESLRTVNAMLKEATARCRPIAPRRNVVRIPNSKP